MSFLKKFGMVILDATKVASLFMGGSPFASLLNSIIPQKAQGAVATVESELTKIAGVVGTAEGMVTAVNSAATGADKLKAATPFVSQIIQASELLVGKKIKNEAAFTAAVQTITGGVADLLNSLEG